MLPNEAAVFAGNTEAPCWSWVLAIDAAEINKALLIPSTNPSFRMFSRSYVYQIRRGRLGFRRANWSSDATNGRKTETIGT